jgi:hypothetical protein
MKERRLIGTGGVILLVSLVATPAFGQSATPPAVQHDLAGRDQCLMCHTAGAMEAVPDAPANHADRPNEACLWCHAADASMQTATPTAVAHELEGRDQCMMCHTPGRMEPVPDAPADHEGRADNLCTLCHATP